MKAVSLFSGIGGMDVAAACVGFEIIRQVEIDEFCQKILRKHAPRYWPNAVIATDVRQFGRADVNGNVDRRAQYRVVCRIERTGLRRWVMR